MSNVVGRGRQKGVAEVYRSHKEQGSLLKKIKLEIAVNEAFVEKTVKAITEGARTGQIGDGKIFVLIYRNVSASAPANGAARPSDERATKTQCKQKGTQK